MDQHQVFIVVEVSSGDRLLHVHVAGPDEQQEDVLAALLLGGVGLEIRKVRCYCNFRTVRRPMPVPMPARVRSLSSPPHAFTEDVRGRPHDRDG